MVLHIHRNVGINLKAPMNIAKTCYVVMVECIYKLKIQPIDVP